MKIRACDTDTRRIARPRDFYDRAFSFRDQSTGCVLKEMYYKDKEGRGYHRDVFDLHLIPSLRELRNVVDEFLDGAGQVQQARRDWSLALFLKRNSPFAELRSLALSREGKPWLPMKGGVYLFYHQSRNGKIKILYVGATENFRKRISHHERINGDDIKRIESLLGQYPDARVTRGGPVCLDRSLRGLSGALQMKGYPRRRSPPRVQGKSVRRGG